MELVDGAPRATGGPVTSFDRRKVEDHLGTSKCGPVIFQGSSVWARDAEAGVIKNWYPGKEYDIHPDDASEEPDIESRYYGLLDDLRDTYATFIALAPGNKDVSMILDAIKDGIEDVGETVDYAYDLY
jgi:hypothetical protein